MATSRRDLRRTLDAMGGQAAAEPRPSFVVGLEARLTHELGTRPMMVSLPRRRRTAWPLIGGLTVLGATVALSGALAGWYGDSDADALELLSAVDTLVVMPDGTEVPGASGLTLPDGSRVRTGPNGLAAAGAVEMGPGIEALVESGRLVLHPLVDRVAPTPAAAVGDVGSGVPTTVVRAGEVSGLVETEPAQ